MKWEGRLYDMLKTTKKVNALVNRRRVVLAALLITSGLVIGVGVALSTSQGETYVPQLGISIPNEKLARHLSHSPSESTAQSSSVAQSASTKAAGPPPTDTTITPGQINGVADYPIPVSSSILTPVNEWIVDTGTMFIGVYAGSAANDPSTGRLVVFRDDHKTTRQTAATIDIAGSGAVTITNAPVGNAAAAGAQTATLAFKTSGGKVGTLNLTTDTVSIGN